MALIDHPFLSIYTRLVGIILCTHIFFFLSSLCNFSPWLPSLGLALLQLPMNLALVSAFAVVEAVGVSMEEAVAEVEEEVGELPANQQIWKLILLLLLRRLSFW